MCFGLAAVSYCGSSPNLQSDSRAKVLDAPEHNAMFRALTVSISSILVTLLIFDTASYFLLPRPFTAVLSDYRKPGTAQKRLELRDSYPANYYVAHPIRGHDIAPDRNLQHYIHELGYYDIWSNELGCFDEPVDINELGSEFIYLAGDSFTWGFTPHETHFGLMLQSQLGVRTIKCGVAGTGQRHQFDKFLETTRQLGRMPTLVIVNVVANDINDDYAYPGFTVINGYLASTRELGPNDELLAVSEETAIQRMKDYVATAPTSTIEELKAWLIERSLTLNLLRTAWRAVKNRNIEGATPEPPGTIAERPARRGFWLLTGDYDHYPSDVDSIAPPNLAVIEAWQQHAATNNYQLLVSIIAYTKVPDYRDYFVDFRARLSDMGVCTVDSSLPIAEHSNPSGYYWPVDGHFNADGHRFYTDFLADVLSDMYSGTSLEFRHMNRLGPACVPPIGMQLSAD